MDKTYLVYSIFYPPDVEKIMGERRFVIAGLVCFVGLHADKEGFRPNFKNHRNEKVSWLAERTAHPLVMEVDKRGLTRDAAAEEVREQIEKIGTLVTGTGPLLNVLSYGLVDARRVPKINRDEAARVAKWRKTMRKNHSWAV